VEYKIKLEQFQGPLDLLLNLIEGQELDISQVALSTVTDQYLEYLDEAEDISTMELADFLAVATKLLVIKSKALLPSLADDEEDSAEQLETQLKIYKDYLEASKLIEGLIGKKRFLFSREKMAVGFEPTFSPPDNLSVSELRDYFTEILHRIDYVVNLPEEVMKKVVTMKEKVTDIRGALKKMGKVNFRDVLQNAESRAEVVVCFMAILEMLKNNEVAINQKGVFDDIMVESIKS